MKTATQEVVGAFGEFYDDPKELEREIERLDKESALVTRLVRRRVAAGLSQRELAKRAGLSASTVSRMEAGGDAQLDIGNVKAYLAGLGIKMEISLEDESVPVAQRILNTVARIGKLLDELQTYATEEKADGVLLDGIRTFRSDVLLNFMLRRGFGEDLPAARAARKTARKAKRPARKRRAEAAHA